MKIPPLHAFLAFSVVFGFVSCQRQPQGPAIVKVGSETITAEDLKSRLQAIPMAYQQYSATPEGRREFLNLLVREKVMLVEARKSGLDKQKNFQDAVAQFKKKAQTDLEDFQNGMLIEMMLAQLRTKDLAVTDTDLRAYYDQHREDYTNPLEIQASHILVRSPEDADRALARLKGGESFEAVAKAVSIDPSTAARGGKLSPFTKGNLTPEFENAVLQLKNGQTSGVVKSKFGYHIIKRTGQRALPAKTFEEAQESIRTRMQRDKFEDWVTRTTASLGVKVDESALATAAVAPSASSEGRMP